MHEWITVHSGKELFESLHATAYSVADGCNDIHLITGKLDNSCAAEEHLGIDKHIPAMLGPTTGSDGSIILAFRREIMYHPDFHFSPNAGVCINCVTGNAEALRPWCGAKKKPRRLSGGLHADVLPF